jgi:hypothetical protein
LSDLSCTAPAAPDRPRRHDAPLELTVHTLPTPQDALALDARRTRAGRWQMLALALVCAAPVAASYFSYYVVRPEGRRNFGALIEPQRALPEVTATDLTGQSVALPALRGQWLLISVAGGACDALCQNNLDLQRQLREGLGQDSQRLDWVWLISDDAPVPAALRPALRAATVLRVPAAELARWLAPEPGRQLDEHLYVVDPMGHWMLRFPARLDKASAPKAKRDLERLMRASSGWNQARHR